MNKSENIVQATKDGLLLALGNAPVIGIPAAALKQALDESRFRKLEWFCEELQKSVGKLEMGQIKDEEKIKKIEETLLLFDRTTSHVEREPEKEKIELYAICIARFLTKDIGIDYDLKLNIIESLDSITLEDIATLQKFSSGKSVRLAQFVDSSLFPMQDHPSVSTRLAKLLPSVAKLESRGLLSEAPDGSSGGGAFAWSGDATSWLNSNRRKCFVITPFGLEFLSRIQK